MNSLDSRSFLRGVGMAHGHRRVSVGVLMTPEEEGRQRHRPRPQGGR